MIVFDIPVITRAALSFPGSFTNPAELFMSINICNSKYL